MVSSASVSHEKEARLDSYALNLRDYLSESSG